MGRENAKFSAAVKNLAVWCGHCTGGTTARKEPAKRADKKSKKDIGQAKKGGKTAEHTIKAGDRYTNGVAVPSALWGKQYTIQAIKSNAILLKEILSWVEV